MTMLCRRGMMTVLVNVIVRFVAGDKRTIGQSHSVPLHLGNKGRHFLCILLVV